MNEIFIKQLSLDYCCSAEDLMLTENCFSIYQKLNGRRKFHEQEECFLKIAAIRGKLLFTGRQEMIHWCKEQFSNTNPAWFFEPATLALINAKLHEYGYEIAQIHPFYIAYTPTPIEPQDLVIQWYNTQEIEQFRGDARFCESYSFDTDAPDVLGVSASKSGELLGMAGASADSPYFWQIGINVLPYAQGHGIATILTTLLKNRVLSMGKIPYYGTAFSHIASQNVAVKSGFRPAWCELTTRKIQ